MTDTGTGSPEGRPGAPFSGLSHVQLMVADVEVSAAWYREALGMEGFVEDPAAGYVALRHRPSRVVIVLTADSADDRPGPADRRGALDHLAFAVADPAKLAAWADHLTAVGIRHHGILLEDGRPSLQLVDPDGTAIELVAPAPRPGPG